MIAREIGVRLAALALAAMLGAAGASPGLAQAVGELAPPPVRQTIDENGVDVIRGSYFPAPKTWLSIGPGGTQGLSLDRVGGLGGISSMLSAIKLVGGQTVVNIGTHSDSFTATAGGFVSTEGNGATLVAVGNGSFIYTARDGTRATFAANGGYQYPFEFGELGRLSRVGYPDGTGLTVTTRVQLYCQGGYDGSICNSPYTYIARVQSITNDNGYQLKVSYADNTNKPDFDTLEAWTTITSVKAINNAVEYCDPAADSCALTNAWPSETAPPDFITVTYAGDRVATATNRGVTYAYAYADNGALRTTTVTDPNGGVRTYLSDTTAFLLKSYKDELNRTTLYDHDALGRVIKITAPELNRTELTYDDRGNVTATLQVAKPGSGLANIATSAAYPASCADPKTCNKPSSTTDAKGAVTDYTYDAAHGGVLTVTRPAAGPGGIRPQTRYTWAQRTPYFKISVGGAPQSRSPIWVPIEISACRTTTSCAGTADEVRTQIGYGAQVTGTANNLLPVTVSSGAGDGSLTATTAFAYDAIGNRTYVDGPLPGTADTSRILYDSIRLPVGAIGPDPDGAGPLKHRAQRITYDANRQVTLAEQGTTAGQTDPDWAAFTALQSVASIVDGNARKLRDTLQAGGAAYSVRQYGYDALGRLDCAATRMNPATWAGLPGACTLAASGSFGTDRIARTLYTAASEVLKVQSAYGTADQADEATNAYTPNGRLQTVADANTNLTTYEYDGFDRVAKTRYPSPTVAGTSSTTDYEQPSYDANGNVTQRRLRDGKVIGYTYDALNRMTAKDVPAGVPAEYDVSYAYNLIGQLTQAIDADAHVANFGYDALGRKTGEQSNWTIRQWAYDLAGRRTRLTWGDGFYVSYDHLVTGEITAIRENGAASGAGVLGAYAYDDLGRRTGLTRGNGTSMTYGYDPVSRLTSLADNLTGATWDRSISFTHNPAGQIAGQTRNNDLYAWTGHYNQNTPEAPNGLNQLVTHGGASLTYDGRGNVATIAGTGYGYTSENGLASVPGCNMTYDPLGRFHYVGCSGPVQWMQYDGDAIIEERGGAGLARRFVWGPGVDEPLVWYEGPGTGDKRWHHQDERGSVVALSDASGNAIAINRYDDYGLPAATNGGRFQYTGQRWVPEVGMHYYKARMYHPVLGRFMQTDPIGYGSGMNLYAYVRGDPVNLIDPLGLTFEGINWDVKPKEPPKKVECTGSLIKRTDCSDIGGFGGSGAASSSFSRSTGGVKALSDGTIVVNASVPTVIPTYSLGDLLEIASNNLTFFQIGMIGELAVERAIAAQGFVVLGRQVRVHTPAGMRIIDYVVDGDLGMRALEVKVNSSFYGGLQERKDSQIFGGQGVVSGHKNFAFPYGSRFPAIPTQVVRVGCRFVPVIC